MKSSIIYLCFVLLSTVTFINCSDNNVVNTNPVEVDTSDFRYPFTDGSSWSYERINNVSNIRPDSILHYFNDYPVVTAGTVTILYDTVINSVMTKCFLDEFTRHGMNYSNRFYFINTDTSFILYAQILTPGFAGIFPLPGIQNPAEDFTIAASQTLNGKLEILSEILYAKLKYPVVTGVSWSINAGFADSITNRYMGFENVNLNSGTVSCMKVNSELSYVSNENFNLYYSKFGLMKKQYNVQNSLFKAPDNPFPIGIIDIYQETKVNSYNIITE